MTNLKDVWKMRKMGVKIKRDLCPSCLNTLTQYVMRNSNKLGNMQSLLEDMNKQQYQMCDVCLQKLNKYAEDLGNMKKGGN